MQLSWANRHREAEVALERPVAEAEAVAEAAVAAAAAAAGGPRPSAGEEPWGMRGSLDMCGDLPLSPLTTRPLTAHCSLLAARCLLLISYHCKVRLHAPLSRAAHQRRATPCARSSRAVRAHHAYP